MAEPAGIADDRLNGWKAIGHFFGRDRSTVMRWARERGLPVRRVPGGKQGSVFALRSELSQWSLARGGLEEGERAPVLAPAAGPPFARSPGKGIWWGAIAALVLLAFIGLAGLAWKPQGEAPTARQISLPRDVESARLYTTAREAWGRRTPQDMKEAIRLYNELLKRTPDFAPGYSGLAEAWLGISEYGEVSPELAYPAARDAARRAIALDVDLAAGHRALGFIAYWSDNDAVSSVRAFQKAIRLDPDDMQSHFWYANVLADIGAGARAEKEYARARLLTPGSHPIEVEYACAQWQAGRDDQAARMLDELSRRYPQDATVHNCLAWVSLGKGDAVGVAREYAALARLRNEPSLIDLSRRLSSAVMTDPRSGLDVLVRDAQNKLALGEWHSHETAAFYASAAGDREKLVAMLGEAVRRHEQWYSAAITARIAARWRGDEVVEKFVPLVTPPPVSFADD